MPSAVWLRSREDLIKRIGKNNFVSWIEPLLLQGLVDGVATFVVPTSFFGDWVKRNFGDQILALLQAEGQSVARLEFVLGQDASIDVSAPLRAPRGLRACHRAGAGAGTMTFKSTLMSGAGVHTLSQRNGRRCPPAVGRLSTGRPAQVRAFTNLPFGSSPDSD